MFDFFKDPNLTFPTQKDLDQAHARISAYVHRTPTLTSETADRLVNSKLFFKCENFQKVGAFKYRGATNKILGIGGDQRSRGVATHSSGNHGQAVALAAKKQGIKAWVVMPENAPEVKKKAVHQYEAEVIYCQPTLEAREEAVEQIISKHGATLIHPYNDLEIVCGQATAAKELIEDTPDLDCILCPVGGGGMLSGASLSAKYFGSRIEVYGAEPTGADDAYRSFHTGEIIPSVEPDTIADGLLTSLGDITFPIIHQHVSDILTVNDQETISAMAFLWERMKIVVEPSAAVPFAAVIKNRSLFENKKVGIILTGGNVDLTHLPF